MPPIPSHNLCKHGTTFLHLLASTILWSLQDLPILHHLLTLMFLYKLWCTIMWPTNSTFLFWNLFKILNLSFSLTLSSPMTLVRPYSTSCYKLKPSLNKKNNLHETQPYCIICATSALYILGQLCATRFSHSKQMQPSQSKHFSSWKTDRGSHQP